MIRYWLIWFLTAFTTFAIPETVMLIRREPENTLSGAVWHMENLVPGQGIWQWDAAHMLFTAAFIVLTVWLIGHFGWGLWR